MIRSITHFLKSYGFLIRSSAIEITEKSTKKDYPLKEKLFSLVLFVVLLIPIPITILYAVLVCLRLTDHNFLMFYDWKAVITGQWSTLDNPFAGKLPEGWIEYIYVVFIFPILEIGIWLMLISGKYGFYIICAMCLIFALIMFGGIGLFLVLGWTGDPQDTYKTTIAPNFLKKENSKKAYKVLITIWTFLYRLLFLGIAIILIFYLYIFFVNLLFSFFFGYEIF